MRSSSLTNDSTVAIDRATDSKYDAIKKVADNIDAIVALSSFDANGNFIVDNTEAVGGKSLATIEAERSAEILAAGLALGTNYSVSDITARDLLVDLVVADTIFVVDNGNAKWEIQTVTAITDGDGSTSTYEILLDKDTYLNSSTASLDNRDTANRDTDNHTDGISNGVYTLAERARLLAIEDSATADQTDAEIKTAYENNANTNEFSDAEQTKLLEFKFDDLNMVSKIGNPTHLDTFVEVYNHMYSSGILSGCDLTDNLDGTISLTAGSATIRANGSTGHDTIYSAEIPLINNLALTDNATNYVYISYNDGITISWGVTTLPTAINMIDIVPAYVIVREGTKLEYIDSRSQNVDHIGKNQIKEFYTAPFTRKNGGSIISDAGTLHLACTAGGFFFQLNDISVPALDTTGTDTFEYYKHVAGAWVETNASVIDNTSYDNGTDLVALSSAKYAAHWVYAIVGSTSHYAVLYGNTSYLNIADAQTATAPISLPPSVEGLGVLLGRVLTQEGNTEIVAIATSFSTTLNSTLATSHENLSELLGGAVGDHVHLTTTELTKLNTITSTSPVNLDYVNKAVGTTPTVQRFDKVLSALDIVAMTNNVDGKLEVVRYAGDDDATIYYRDVLSYNVDLKLVLVKHFYGTADLITESGSTALGYVNNILNTAAYTE